MGRGNRTTEAAPRARQLLYGPRKSGAGPVEIKVAIADCVETLDSGRLPLSFAAAGAAIARPAKIHSTNGLAEGELVHQYFLTGLADNGYITELAFVRDNQTNYLSLSHEFELSPDNYDASDMPASGGAGEKQLLSRLARDCAGDEIMVEFIALNAIQTKAILDNYPATKMKFGATQFGDQSSESERLRHLVENNLFDLSEDDHDLLDKFDNLSDLVKEEPELLMRMAEDTTIYMEMPLNDLAQEMGWLDD